MGLRPAVATRTSATLRWVAQPPAQPRSGPTACRSTRCVRTWPPNRRQADISRRWAVESLSGVPGVDGNPRGSDRRAVRPSPRAGAGASRSATFDHVAHGAQVSPGAGRTMSGANYERGDLGAGQRPGCGRPPAGSPTSRMGALEALDHRSLNQQVVRPTSGHVDPPAEGSPDFALGWYLDSFAIKILPSHTGKQRVRRYRATSSLCTRLASLHTRY